MIKLNIPDVPPLEDRALYDFLMQVKTKLLVLEQELNKDVVES